MVVDLKNFGIDGIEAEKILEKANILANRNVVLGDLKPFRPSGIRIGTPTVTSRGMKEKEMKIIAQFIYRLLVKKEKPEEIKKEVLRFLKKFPIYEN
jgi:glycine hydroxymethyltransferase